jgi:hypothetical protein
MYFTILYILFIIVFDREVCSYDVKLENNIDNNGNNNVFFTT